ncbi:MAG TPA: LacI family DNA-binding transcriptional regulator [Lentisphaeria bacterium]|nr:LacI family transcriptional regulator [Lentisphaerota bacterium]OQC12738.1 MAG: Catabolite repressor/activator [Lentisphaerae bacterium ADurb.Bin082]HPY89666.1 LacI family DNA-binding transcriptional regulator [Lentisphaeria bacterium]HQC52223.1 LacI family DNA-binding transcriptional regulator [Lentisphaeria bacterium]
MSISLRELAELAGVSRTAVSLVMNGKGRGNVSAQKAALIRSLAHKHGYRPSLMARSLRGCDRKLIGILMTMPTDYYGSLFCGLLQSRLRERDYMPLFSFWRDYSEVAACYESVLYHQVDGIIAWQNPTPHLAGSTPQVLYELPDCRKHDVVLLDTDTMLKEAIDHFLAAKRKRIAIEGIRNRELYQKVTRYLRQKKAPPPARWYGTWEEITQHLTAAEVHKPDFPDAIFIHNDGKAAALAAFLRKHGRRVPEDVMIIGHNNLLEILPCEPLPTFNISHEEIVDKLIELLFRRMAQPDAELVKVMIKTPFVPKSNTVVYAIGKNAYNE